MSSPRRVFIMGGGEGSAAREALKHDNILKVVISDIDQVIISLKTYLFFSSFIYSYLEIFYVHKISDNYHTYSFKIYYT